MPFIAGDSLVVAEVDDLQLLHVAHLLGQGLQLVGVQEQHGGVLPVPHLKGSGGQTERTGSGRVFQRGQYSGGPPAVCAARARSHLGGKLDEEVVIRGEGADAGALADGGGQGLDLVEAAVQLVQHRQPAQRKQGEMVTGRYI